MADIVMPQLGESVTEGTITRWFKQVGESTSPRTSRSSRCRPTRSTPRSRHQPPACSARSGCRRATPSTSAPCSPSWATAPRAAVAATLPQPAPERGARRPAAEEPAPEPAGCRSGRPRARRPGAGSRSAAGTRRTRAGRRPRSRPGRRRSGRHRREAAVTAGPSPRRGEPARPVDDHRHRGRWPHHPRRRARRDRRERVGCSPAPAAPAPAAPAPAPSAPAPAPAAPAAAPARSTPRPPVGGADGARQRRRTESLNNIRRLTGEAMVVSKATVAAHRHRHAGRLRGCRTGAPSAARGVQGGGGLLAHLPARSSPVPWSTHCTSSRT